jgi:hypothetical protein
MAGSIKNLVAQFENFSLTGTPSSAIPYFKALQVEIADGVGKMRPMPDILRDVNKAFQGMSAARRQAMGAGLGFDENTINVLGKTPQELEIELARQAKINALSDASGKAAIKRQEAWNALVQTASDLGRKMLDEVTPAILKVLEALQQVIEFLKANQPVVLALVTALGALSAMSFVRTVAGILSMLAPLASVSLAAAGLSGLLGAIAVGGAAYAAGSLVNNGISALLSKSQGKETTLGGWIYDLLNPDPNAKKPSRRGSGKVASTSDAAGGAGGINGGNLAAK